MSKKDIKFEKIKLDEVISYINNQKKHPTEQVEKIMSSIKEFGVINPLIVDKDNVLIAGHGRYEALKRLKYDEVPIIRAEHLTTAQVKAYRIADNKLAELAIWDNELLAIDLSELDNIGFDMDILGFSGDELDEILKNVDFDNDYEIKEEKYIEKYEIIIECNNEEEQEKLFNEFIERGLKCRVQSL